MSEVRKAIKRNAKRAMQGAWGRAAVVLIILVAVGAALGLLELAFQTQLGLRPYLDAAGTPADYLDDVLNTTWPYLLFSGVAGLVVLILVAPMEIGVADWYMCRTDGEDLPVSAIFWPYGCKTFWSAIWLKLLTYGGSMLWGMLFFVLPMAGLGWATYGIYTGGLDTAAQALNVVAVVASVLLFVLASVFLSAMLSRYLLAPYLLSRRYAKGPWKALRLSVRYTRGHRWESLVLAWSFLPWNWLCILLFPVAFYVIPYQSMSYALYARYLIESAGKIGDTREFKPTTQL